MGTALLFFTNFISFAANLKRLDIFRAGNAEKTAVLISVVCPFVKKTQIELACANRFVDFAENEKRESKNAKSC